MIAGSSPHTRGAPGSRDPTSSTAGIIPAYAGSTQPLGAQQHREPDHPRIRGEHVERIGKRPNKPGSSPHTRGARGGGRRQIGGRGIIPAYAGSTHAFRSRRNPTIGSSPHTRGARSSLRCGFLLAGIIPAYAGSTATNGLRTRCGSDHPRIRGEHVEAYWYTSPTPGSSPHTRGAPHAVPRRSILSGIIPAYAGSTKPKP